MNAPGRRGRELAIDELALRVPGLGVDQARRLADELARRLAAGMPTGAPPLSLGALPLRLSLPSGLSVEQMAERIARAVLERLHPTPATGADHG